MASKFNIIAHRGHRSVAPENTLAAFQAALSEGYSHFELDAQLSSDGCCIVIHDDDLDRTTDGSGRVGEVRQSCSSGMTCTCSYSRDRTNRRAFGMHGVEPVDLACIRTLDAGSWYDDAFKGEAVPTLETIVKEFRLKAHIHLELKSDQPGLPDKVALVLRQHWLEEWTSQDIWAVPGLTITSFHLDQLTASIKLLPEVRHTWLVQEITQAIVNRAVELGVRQLAPRTNVLTADAVNLAQAAGLSVRAWGVKNVEMIDDLMRLGVLGATIDWPHQATQHLSNLASDSSTQR